MTEVQPARRIFLGLDAPPLVAGADYLEQTYPPEQDEWNLAELLVVVPLTRDGRRIVEILTDRASERGVRLLPPAVFTIGDLPEQIYPLKRPVASRLLQRLVWGKVLREMETGLRTAFIPQPPDDSDEARWEQLGGLISRQHEELAGHGYTFADVADVASTLPGFDETDRWQALAVAQQAYRDELRHLERIDPQDAMVAAVREGRCASSRDVILMTSGMDVPRGVRNVVAAVAECVTVLIAAPESWSEGYDAFGFINPPWWLDRRPEIRDEHLIVTDDPQAQADAVVTWLRSHGGHLRADELTVGVADPRLFTIVGRRLAEVGVMASYAEGRSVSATPPAQVVAALAEWLAIRESVGPDGLAADWPAMSALVRLADVAETLGRLDVPEGWLGTLDRYAAEHLPIGLNRPFRGDPETIAPLDVLATTLEQWLAAWEGPPRPMTAWVETFRAFLLTLYEHRRDLDPRIESDRQTVEGLRALLAAAMEFSHLPASVMPTVTGAEALRAILAGVEGARLPTADGDEAIGLRGWLQLPRDEASSMIVVGLNEGFVPSSTSSDLFLPNQLRAALDLDDNTARMARDAQALAILVARYPTIRLVASRTDPEGYPLRPSRLLMGTEATTMARRLAWFFDPRRAATLFPELLPAIDPTGADGSRSLAREERNADSVVGVPEPTLPERTELPVPPPTGGRLVERLSASAINAYITCPYRFYLEKVLGIRGLPTELPEMEATHFGTLTHVVMEAFAGSSFVRATNPDALRGVFSRLLDEAVRQTFGSALSAAMRLQVEQVRRRLVAFAPHQAALSEEGWRIVASERRVETTIDVDGVPFTLFGDIDRIDVHERTGDVRVLDYKTFGKAATPEEKHRKRQDGERAWVNVQLPMYRILAASCPDLRGRPITTGYLLLPQEVEKVGVELAAWTDEDYAEAEDTIRGVIRDVRQGVFWPPAPPHRLSFPTDFDDICQAGVLDAWPGLTEVAYPNQ